MNVLSQHLPNIEHFYLFSIAAILGGLIGLERQFSKPETQHEFVGVRTFVFITILGSLSAMISSMYLSWFIAVGFIGMIVLVVSSCVVEARSGGTGVTTEVTELLAFLIGAITWWGHIRLAIALAVGVTMLLSMKTELHRATRMMSIEDIRAILKFAVISFIVLPILPANPVDPWGLFNPHEVWVMVVLISGVSFMGYLLLKFVHLRGGVEWTGAIGGLISSTATTWSFSGRSKASSSVSMLPHLALGILLACSVMFPRLLVLVAAVGPSLVKPLAVPFVLMAAAGAASSYYWWRRYEVKGEKKEDTLGFRNPVEIAPALTFGAIYAVIRIISTLADRYFGNRGLLVTSILSGMADVDAIALSVAKMVTANTPEALNVYVGAKCIIIAAVMNSITKAAIVWIFASRRLRRPVVSGLLAIALVGIGYYFLI